MDQTSQRMMMGAVGYLRKPVLVQNVFSTTLYTGNNTTNVITNGLDLSGEGGLVWVKLRNTGATNHCLWDTIRGRAYVLRSDTNSSQAGPSSATNDLISFNTNGFTLGSGAFTSSNDSGFLFASWVFRKSSNFFDVVSYTGNGSAQTISHNLKSQPGLMIVKRYDSTSNWSVYHSSIGATKALFLEDSQVSSSNVSSGFWNNTSPTSTSFTVGTTNSSSGASYIAYLFANDTLDNNILCGSYTGNGSSTGPTVTLGFQPQWLMVKRNTNNEFGDWFIYDNKRDTSNPIEIYLRANANAAESSGSRNIDFLTTGFQIKSSDDSLNANGSNYIYMAIRNP